MKMKVRKSQQNSKARVGKWRWHLSRDLVYSLVYQMATRCQAALPTVLFPCLCVAALTPTKPHPLCSTRCQLPSSHCPTPSGTSVPSVQCSWPIILTPIIRWWNSIYTQMSPPTQPLPSSPASHQSVVNIPVPVPLMALGPLSHPDYLRLCQCLSPSP